MNVCARARGVLVMRNRPLTYAVVENRLIHAECMFVDIGTPMKEIFKRFELDAHYEHLENDTLLPLTHSPAPITKDYYHVIINNPCYNLLHKDAPTIGMLLIIIGSKKDYYVIGKSN